MRYGFTFLLAALIGVVFFWHSRDQEKDLTKVEKKEVIQPFSKGGASPVEKESIAIINLSLKGNSTPSLTTPSREVNSNNLDDIDMGRIQSNIDKKHYEIKEKIFNLDTDVLNKEVQQDLKIYLQGASEYRENLLIKAKQEMLEK